MGWEPAVTDGAGTHATGPRASPGHTARPRPGRCGASAETSRPHSTSFKIGVATILIVLLFFFAWWAYYRDYWAHIPDYHYDLMLGLALSRIRSLPSQSR